MLPAVAQTQNRDRLTKAFRRVRMTASWWLR